MSLIFDALKKAEKEQQKNTNLGMKLPNPIINDKNEKKQKQRILILTLLLFLAGVFLAYTRFFKKTATSITTTTVTPKITNAGDPAQLKTKAAELANNNKLEESLALWKQLTLLLPTDAEVYNNLGFVLKKMGKKEDAYQAYHQSLALKKDYPEAQNNLGVLLLEDGARLEAKTEFQKAIDSPNYADPHFNLALILEQEGNSKEAANQYKTFLRLAPNGDEELKKKDSSQNKPV